MEKRREIKLVLVIVMDCYNVGHIAFHGMGELDYHGRRTGVIYGFMLRILSLAKIYETPHFAFCWDSQQSLRRLHYPGYKDRGEKKLVVRGTGEVIDYHAFHTQMEELRNVVLPKLGFRNSYMAIGYEADDLMASVVTSFPCDPGIHYVLVTTDRDLYQMLRERVSIYNMRAKKTFTMNDFKKRYGIEPHQWVEAKCIGGCDSDTVVGVVGVADPAKSPKSRALAYLKGDLTKGQAYDDIVCDHGRWLAERNYPLIKLPYNNITVPELTTDELNREAFMEVFDEYGFLSFLKKDKWGDWEKYFGLAKEQKASRKPAKLGMNTKG